MYSCRSGRTHTTQACRPPTTSPAGAAPKHGLSRRAKSTTTAGDRSPPETVAATPCEPSTRSRQHGPTGSRPAVRVMNRPVRRPSDLGGVVGVPSDLATVLGRHGADRLDFELPAIDSRAGDHGGGTVRVDEPHERGDGRYELRQEGRGRRQDRVRPSQLPVLGTEAPSAVDASVKIPRREHPRAPVREQRARQANARALSSDRPSTLPPR
jgi:hypothetical protein